MTQYVATAKMPCRPKKFISLLGIGQQSREHGYERQEVPVGCFRLICNAADRDRRGKEPRQTASVAVARQAGIYDTRFVLTGWYNVDPGYCNTTGVLIPWGNYYLFAESLVTGAMWSGNDQRFCVDVNYRFSRYIDSSPGCPPGLVARGFGQYYVSGTNLVTWTLTD
jgi:uncharacterized membrane protein